MVRQDETAHIALRFAKLIVQFPFFVYLYIHVLDNRLSENLKMRQSILKL